MSYKTIGTYSNIVTNSILNEKIEGKNPQVKECFRFYVSGGRKQCKSSYGFDEYYPKGLYQGRPIGFEYTPMEDRYKFVGKLDNTSYNIGWDGMQSPVLNKK
jgi:hypothetical protein